MASQLASQSTAIYHTRISLVFSVRILTLGSFNTVISLYTSANTTLSKMLQSYKAQNKFYSSNCTIKAKRGSVYMAKVNLQHPYEWQGMMG